MIFYMGSKTFQDEFLMNESDDDILNAQYIIVSQRIMRHGDDKDTMKNIIIGNSVFYPTTHVLSSYHGSDKREAYMRQLDSNKVYIASILSAVLERGYHIIFLCSEKELKIRYFQYLAEYFMEEFKYPIYDYLTYSLGIDELVPYDKDKILKRCRKIAKSAKDKNLKRIIKETDILSEYDENKVRRELKKYSKSELTGIVDEMGMLEDGASKSDLIDTIITFM